MIEDWYWYGDRPPRADVEEDEIAAEGAGANLQQSVATLVAAMRDLLSNIQLPELPFNDSNDEEDDHSDWLQRFCTILLCYIILHWEERKAWSLVFLFIGLLSNE